MNSMRFIITKYSTPLLKNKTGIFNRNCSTTVNSKLPAAKPKIDDGLTDASKQKVDKFGKKVMIQVEVDEKEIQERLGKIAMATIRKAEKERKDSAVKYRILRYFNAKTGIATTLFAIGIYLYTIFAIKQETFLDDFEMPNPLPDEDEQQ